MLVEVIERASAYRDAGADGLFAPGLAEKRDHGGVGNSDAAPSLDRG